MPDDDAPRQNVSFPSNGGQAHGYLAVAAGGRGPGLLVIQEWWGLTSHIADLVDRFAAEGFVALAPDLFGGRTTHDAEEAGRLMAALPAEQAVSDLEGAVAYLLSRPEVTADGVGAVGFCMGGSFVLHLAAADDRVRAAVAFYPAGALPERFESAARVQVHFGAEDAFVPAAVAEQLVATVRAGSGNEPEVHHYPAGHAFVNDGNLLGTYAPDQATLAWDRAVSFLRDALAAG